MERKRDIAVEGLKNKGRFKKKRMRRKKEKNSEWVCVLQGLPRSLRKRK